MDSQNVTVYEKYFSKFILIYNSIYYILKSQWSPISLIFFLKGFYFPNALILSYDREYQQFISCSGLPVWVTEK